MIPISQIEELLNSGDWFRASSALNRNRLEQDLREEIELEKAIKANPTLKPPTLLEKHHRSLEVDERYQKVVEYMNGQQQVKKEEGLEDPKQAKLVVHAELVPDWVQAMRSGMIPGKKSKGPFSEKTIKDYQSYVLPFLERYQALTIDSFMAHLGSIAPEKYAAKDKCYKALTCFSKFLRVKKCLSEEFLEEIKQFAPPENPNPKRTTLKEEDIPVILAACRSDEDRVLVGLLLYAGLRATEAAHLKWEDVSWEHCYMLILRTKNKEDRKAPLLEPLKSFLAEYYASRAVKFKKGFILYRQDGKPLNKDGVAKRIGRIVLDAKLKGISAHSLRRAFVTINAHKGRSLPMIQRAVGHKSVQTTELYLNTAESEFLKETSSWSM